MAAVPPLVPVADAAAAAWLGAEAAGVPAGVPAVHADWLAASDDYHRREGQSRQMPARVTPAEVAAALYRTQAIYNRLQPVGGHQQLMQQLQQQTQQLRLIRRRLRAMEARMTNQAVRQHNRTQRAAPVGQAQPLSPLMKERRQQGPPLPGALPSVQAFAAVGMQCANFPATMAAVGGLKHAQLSWLAEWYNNHFGIVAGDNVRLRQAKFIDFIT